MIWGRRRDRDLDDELAAHLALAAEERIRGGASPQQAAAAARKELGSTIRIKENAREIWGWIWLESLIRDCHYAIRTLTRTPVFTVTAIGAVALGIGANTAVFSIIDALLLRPLHVPHPERVVVFSKSTSDGRNITSPMKFNVWRSQTDLFEAVSASDTQRVMNLSENGRPLMVRMSKSSAGYFRVFGVPMFRGRVFTEAEDRPGGEALVVLSFGFWSEHFGADPAAIGKTIRIGGMLYRIVGIVAKGWFPDFGNIPDVYVPFQIEPNSRDAGDSITVAARLKPGVSIARVRAKLKPISEQFRRDFTGWMDPGEQFSADTLMDAWFGEMESPAILFQCAVGFVLLIACANVANLLLARGAARQRELAIRTSLGAARRRVVRQLLTESVLLSLAGSVAGLGLGLAGIKAILAANSAVTQFMAQRVADAGLDWRVAAFTGALGIVTVALFGVAPSLRRAPTRHQNRIHAVLTVVEMALAVILLAGAGLMLRSFAALRHTDPGFDARNVITLEMPVSDRRFAKTQAVAEAIHAGIAATSRLPGVTSVAATPCLPISCSIDLPFLIAGRGVNGPSLGDVFWTPVSEHYFETLRIPLLKGRSFTDHDDQPSLPVIVINEAMARRYWPGGDPLGQRVMVGKGLGPRYEDQWRQVVGIVGDVRLDGLDELPKPAVYIPEAQVSDMFNAALSEGAPLEWIVRSDGTPLGIDVQRALEQANAGVAVAKIRTMNDITAGSIEDSRFAAMLLSVFGAAALLLAAIGIYGVMAYSVGQQSREIGIRMALGAGAAQVRKRVVMEGAKLAVTGALIGIAAAMALSRALASELYGVKPWDPITMTIAPLVLCSVALAAVWWPARRASRIDPMEAIRHE